MSKFKPDPEILRAVRDLYLTCDPEDIADKFGVSITEAEHYIYHAALSRVLRNSGSNSCY